MSPPAAHRAERIYRFDAFTVDEQRLELCENGRPVPIHRTPLKLLIHLASQRRRTVPKHELAEAVWLGRDVSDYAISSALKELRHVLHDDGRTQRYVRTIRGRGYRFVADLEIRREKSPAPTLVLAPAATRPSDPDVDGFADAVRQLVAARLLAMGVVVRLPTRGADLQIESAEHVLATRVTRHEARFRITASLVEARTGGLLWADASTGSFPVAAREEKRLAHHIARGVAARFSRATPAATTDSSARRAAIDAYLAGLHHYRQYNQSSLEASLECFESAIARDTSFARPYAARARCYLALGTDFGVCERAVAVSRARKLVARALDLDATLADALAVKAEIAAFADWSWDRAETAIEEALEVAPDDPACLMTAARLAAALGHTAEGTAMGRRAMARDVLRVQERLAFARLLTWDRRIDEAAAEHARLVEMEPELAIGHRELGMSLLRLGRPDEAVVAWSRAQQLEGVSAEIQRELLAAYERDAIDGYLRAWTRAAHELTACRPSLRPWIWIPPASLGDLDEAFAQLEPSVESREEWLAFAAVDPIFDPLREDPRFDTLLERVGVPCTG
jgi:DNA-binding winged helix-turn-helix (wHTH) protein/tetratricopeptide (TPR) repeat protein